MFVPVLEDEHWWCAAFSINREEVLVIDSMETSKAADVHHLTLIKLVSMGLLLLFLHVSMLYSPSNMHEISAMQWTVCSGVWTVGGRRDK